MRDPNRIEPMLAAIRNLWLTHPDLRLGQIIVNAMGVSKEDLDQALFYIEDDKLKEKIESFGGLTDALLPQGEDTTIG